MAVNATLFSTNVVDAGSGFRIFHFAMRAPPNVGDMIRRQVVDPGGPRWERYRVVEVSHDLLYHDPKGNPPVDDEHMLDVRVLSEGSSTAEGDQI